MPKPRTKRMTKAPQIMGGALPAPGSIAQMAGRVFSNPTVPQSGRAGQMGQASTAASRTFNTMLGPVTAPTVKAGLKPSKAPKVPKPVDTSPKPVMQQYSHPAAKTRPDTTAHMRSPQKGRPARGGAKPY